MIKVAGHPRTVFKRKIQSLFIIKKTLSIYPKGKSHFDTITDSPSPPKPPTRQPDPSSQKGPVYHLQNDDWWQAYFVFSKRRDL